MENAYFTYETQNCTFGKANAPSSRSQVPSTFRADSSKTTDTSQSSFDDSLVSFPIRPYLAETAYFINNKLHTQTNQSNMLNRPLIVNDINLLHNRKKGSPHFATSLDCEMCAHHY
ncbi:hypothetical protein Tcan_18858 [Toxocara canis]|uniref:Uncharacterized protein n=1 Tax=Toxocara canis TaxID=6265 RepID=A0A0B2W2G7_TOXCA|nr:hypothetical protein Tcan_18858 [Toxocara canis]